jgi:hypothetical protein
VTRDSWFWIFNLGVSELWLGREREALVHLERAQRLLRRVRLEAPCCARNVPESCILPIHGGAIHTATEGATAAIRQFRAVLDGTEPDSDLHLGARWLLNIAHMTLGRYPAGVPSDERLPPRFFGTPTWICS